VSWGGLAEGVTRHSRPIRAYRYAGSMPSVCALSIQVGNSR
jgi:hypothetical protein